MKDGEEGVEKTRKGGHGEAIFFEEGHSLLGVLPSVWEDAALVLNRACTEVLPKTSAKPAKKLPLELGNQMAFPPAKRPT